MGHMTRLLLKPSEYRESSWKAKWNPCSSLLMICTVLRASLPGEETPALGGVLVPAPQVPQQILLRRRQEAFLEGLLRLLFSPLPRFLAFNLIFFPSFSFQVTLLPQGTPPLPSRTLPVACSCWVALPPQAQLSCDSGGTLFSPGPPGPVPSCFC